MDFLKVAHYFSAVCLVFGSIRLSYSIPAWKVFSNTYVHYNAAWSPNRLGQEFFDSLPRSLTHLTIVNGGISIITNSTFGKLSNLGELVIESNKIQDIHSNAFRNQTRLKSLSLYKNAYFVASAADCINGYSFVLSPLMLNGLSAIIKLDLSYLGLGNVELNKHLFEPLKSLEELLLGGNCFKYVAEDAFDHLVNLRKLNLTRTLIENLQPNTFSKLIKLKELYLSPSRLKKIPNDALAVPSLEVLYLGGEFTGIIEFHENFNNKTKLKKFAMNGCYPSSSSFFIDCISLNITNDSFTNVRAKHFLFHQHQGLRYAGLKNLLSFPPECEDLYLGWHDGLIGHVLSPTFFQGSYERIRNIEALTLIHLGIIGIQNSTFTNFTSLKSLTLSHNQLINPLVAENAFWGLKELRKLDLSFNSLLEVPYLALFKDQSCNCKLTNVRLNENQIRMLKENTLKDFGNIETFDLRKTLVGDSSANGFRSMTSLKDLKLTGNRFSQLGSLVGVLSNLTTLVHLDLSENEFVEGQYNDTLSLSMLHQLKCLKLSDYGADLRLLTDVQSIEELHLVNPQGYDMVLSWKKNKLFFPNLLILHISGSQMSLDRDMLSSMPSLTILELQNNRIDVLDRDALAGLVSLEHLDLTYNDIKEISGHAWRLPSLHTLYLPGNKLLAIEEDDIDRKYLPSLRYVDFSKNSFACHCNLVWFRNWIASDKIVDLLNYHTFTCTSPSSPRGVMLVRDFDPSTLACQSLTHVYLAVGLALFAILVAVIAVTGVYYRWHIKYAIFLIRCKVKGYARIPDPEKDYDAFISFNSGDEEWVQHTLVPHLEENCNTQFKICVHYKDFIPGKAIIDNILDSIENSRKTVLVLSPNFVKSEWCHFEMQMAHHRLFEDRRDVVVLLLLEPIPDKDTPRMLRKLLLKRSYITWPKKEQGPARQLFWAQLESALNRPSQVDHIQDV
ncbi:toll-like receptor 2 [Ptychodera flava]|uniref:toll-like receptor 2 n=1 Tax=Ptychodera flava TaxID=63121 RepID=UPI00396A18A4